MIEDERFKSLIVYYDVDPSVMKTNLNILPLKNETMKRITTLLLSCLVSTGPLLAQQGVTQCGGTPTEQAPFPIQSYKELPDPVAPSEKEWAKSKPLRYNGEIPIPGMRNMPVPVIQPQKSITLEGWRGEKLHAQAVVWTGTDLKGLNYSFSNLKTPREMYFRPMHSAEVLSAM